jgi:protein O-GlcNAc transferase
MAMTQWASRFRRRCQQAGSSRRAHRRIAHRACPLCESHDSPAVRDADCSKHPIYQQALASVMNWHECRDCGHVFTEGYSAANAALIVFGKTQPNQTVGYDIEPQRTVPAKFVARVARRMPEGRWLAAGFGNGSLLFTAEEWGFTPAGLDLREANVRATKAWLRGALPAHRGARS